MSGIAARASATNTRKVAFFAPNVHTGGGLTLLQALLRAWPSDAPCIAFLDMRARDDLTLPADWIVTWCHASPAGRFRAERALFRATKSASLVFAFHSLPPLLPVHLPVVCFVHNPYVAGVAPVDQLSGWTKWRNVLESALFRRLAHRVTSFVVQTPSMQRAVCGILARKRSDANIPVDVMPFVDPESMRVAEVEVAPTKRYDFIFAADGLAHKNHRRLFAAWALLAQRGYRPSLCVTLPDRDATLIAELNDMRSRYELNIDNLGFMPRAKVLTLYLQCKALIFPSYSETFGMPLLEAKASGLPIIASELDFTRDVCEPVETFDPLSSTSIMRAVLRFLSGKVDSVTPVDPSTFCAYVLAQRNGLPVQRGSRADG